MSVQVTNCYQGYDAGWNMTTKTNVVKLSERCHARLIREAQRDYLEGYGFDWAEWTPEVVLSEEITAQIEWKHKTTGREIHLTRITFDRRTGKIEQAGTNYGSLTL
jgi:hypothetical protein